VLRGGLPRWIDVEINEPVSWLLGFLAVAFAWGGLDNILNPLFYISPAFVAALVGFAAHELAHKLVSKRYGAAAGFVAYIPGLIITFLSGLIPGILILAPGYVRVLYYGYAGRGALYGIAAGPGVNIVIAGAAQLLAPLAPYPLSVYLLEIADLNAWFAFFNLLPVPPLDGSKIMRMDQNLWIAMILVAGILVFAT